MDGFGAMAAALSELSPKIKKTIENLEVISTSTKEFTEIHLKDSNKEGILSKLNVTLSNLEAMSNNLKLATDDAENITKSTNRSVINIQQSLKSIADDVKTLSDSYGNPSLLLNQNRIPENNHE